MRFFDQLRLFINILNIIIHKLHSFLKDLMQQQHHNQNQSQQQRVGPLSQFNPGETADNFTQKASQLNKYQVQSEEFNKQQLLQQPDFARKRSILKNKNVSENQLFETLYSGKKEANRQSSFHNRNASLLNQKDTRPTNYNLTVTNTDDPEYVDHAASQNNKIAADPDVVDEEQDDLIQQLPTATLQVFRATSQGHQRGMKKMNSLPNDHKITPSDKKMRRSGEELPKIEFGMLGSEQIQKNQTKQVNFGNSRAHHGSFKVSHRSSQVSGQVSEFGGSGGQQNGPRARFQSQVVSFLKNNLKNKDEDQFSSCESQEVDKDLDEYVEYQEVQDRALRRMTNLIKIRDPCNGNLLATIRDPKCKIEPYKSRDAIIDIQEYIDKQELPQFYKGQPSIDFARNNKLSWSTLLDMIKSEDRQQLFWDLVKDVKQLRMAYNRILFNKFKVVKKKQLFSKNEKIHQLFNEFAFEINQGVVKKRKNSYLGGGNDTNGQTIAQSEKQQPELKSEEQFLRKVGDPTRTKRKMRPRNSTAQLPTREDDAEQRSRSSFYSGKTSRDGYNSNQIYSSMERIKSVSSTNLLCQLGNNNDDVMSEFRTTQPALKQQYQRQNLALERRKTARFFSDGTPFTLFQRISEADLKRPLEDADQPVREQYMTDFLKTIFDDYLKECIEFYNARLTTFEEKLEPLKREIQLEHLANKKQNGGKMTAEMSTMLIDRTSAENYKNQTQDKSGFGLIKALETDLSRKKFPSLAILGQMGIRNFKPSIRHKIANTYTVTPRIGIYSQTSQLSCRLQAGGNSKPSDTAFTTGGMSCDNAMIDIRDNDKLSGGATGGNSVKNNYNSGASSVMNKMQPLPEVQLFTTTSVQTTSGHLTSVRQSLDIKNKQPSYTNKNRQLKSKAEQGFIKVSNYNNICKTDPVQITEADQPTSMMQINNKNKRKTKPTLLTTSGITIKHLSSLPSDKNLPRNLIANNGQRNVLETTNYRTQQLSSAGRVDEQHIQLLEIENNSEEVQSVSQTGTSPHQTPRQLVDVGSDHGTTGVVGEKEEIIKATQMSNSSVIDALAALSHSSSQGDNLKDRAAITSQLPKATLKFSDDEEETKYQSSSRKRQTTDADHQKLRLRTQTTTTTSPRAATTQSKSKKKQQSGSKQKKQPIYRKIKSTKPLLQGCSAFNASPGGAIVGDEQSQIAMMKKNQEIIFAKLKSRHWNSIRAPRVATSQSVADKPLASVKSSIIKSTEDLRKTQAQQQLIEFFEKKHNQSKMKQQQSLKTITPLAESEINFNFSPVPQSVPSTYISRASSMKHLHIKDAQAKADIVSFNNNEPSSSLNAAPMISTTQLRNQESLVLAYSSAMPNPNVVTQAIKNSAIRSPKPLKAVAKKTISFLTKQTQATNQNSQTETSAVATSGTRNIMKNLTGGMSLTINAIHKNFDFMSQVIRDSENRIKDSQQVLASSQTSNANQQVQSLQDAVSRLGLQSNLDVQAIDTRNQKQTRPETVAGNSRAAAGSNSNNLIIANKPTADFGNKNSVNAHNGRNTVALLKPRQIGLRNSNTLMGLQQHQGSASVSGSAVLATSSSVNNKHNVTPKQHKISLLQQSSQKKHLETLQANRNKSPALLTSTGFLSTRMSLRCDSLHPTTSQDNKTSPNIPESSPSIKITSTALKKPNNLKIRARLSSQPQKLQSSKTGGDMSDKKIIDNQC